ncbi:MAG: methylmalonyl-CoA mutase [Cytophagaceae bacterium]|nr:MAG: methylmalonyl-CoA mutase [Cytophagaceae bacterium]
MPTPFPTPFPPATHAEWLSQVQKDLKDSNVYEGLRWSSPEGFTVEPYYTAEQMEANTAATIQQAQKNAPGWLNTPAYSVTSGNEKGLNASLRDAILNGAEALVLHMASQSGDEFALSRLLDGIKLSSTPIFFKLATGVDAGQFLQLLKQVAPYQLRGGLLSDAGTLPTAVLADLISQGSESPTFRTIGISSHDFHTAGATATQELAFTLARLAETYAQLIEAGLSIEQLISKTMLSVSVGTSYFMEMAKLRALRVLVARLYPAATGQSILLHCQTSTFYEAAATPYTNLLRATTEAMAAVIGGADALTVRPYDAVLAVPRPSTSGEFSERIARNVSTMLKAESYLDKVADPAAGSYYIENLTQQLVDAAWDLFHHVQDMGGLTKAMEAGYVQQELDKSYAANVEAVRAGRVLVGVTKFRHDEEGAEANPEPGNNAPGTANRRLASEFE